MLGLAFGEGTQVFDFHTLQDHQSPFTDSDQLYKTAMRDRAHLIYEGLINIRTGSYGSNGYQANRNVLLSDTAKADSIPMLEISDNDVLCTHGSSVGPIDQTHVYYLLTRGLPRPVAERLVIQGFFEPVIERIAVDDLKDRVRAAVDRKIGEQD
jgi:Fe-S cluster assembly protein SufD